MKPKDEKDLIARTRKIEQKMNMLDFNLEVMRGLLYLCLTEKNVA